MNKILLAVVFSTGFVMMSASAAEPYTASASKIYIGAGGGIADTDSHNTSFKVFAGIQATPNIGVEAAYNNFGDYRGDNADSWSAALVGTIPLDKTWDIFGKVGATENHVQYVSSSHNTDLLLGVGIGYNASKNVSVRLEYEDFGDLPDDPNGSSTKVTNVGLSMKYAF